MNHTLLLPIPKISTATCVSDYRLISDHNMAYKIMSKLLANRLKPQLRKCVSEN